MQKNTHTCALRSTHHMIWITPPLGCLLLTSDISVLYRSCYSQRHSFQKLSHMRIQASFCDFFTVSYLKFFFGLAPNNAMEWLLRNSCKKSAGDLLHIRAGSIPDSLPNITTTNCLICQPLPFKNVTRTTLLLWYARVVFAFLQFPIW